MRVSRNQRSLLLKKFADFLSSERKVSQKSVRNYRSDLNNFLNWCRYFSTESPIPFLTSSLVTFYKKAQVENRVPVATINRRLSTLRNFAEFLMFEGLLEKNPLEAIPNIKSLTSTKEPAPVYATADGWRGRRESRRVPAGRLSTEDIGRDEPATGPVLKIPQPQPTPKPLPPRMPKELTTPYKVKGDDSLFLHRAKITTAAISGFGSVFVLLFIAKSIFGDALLFGPLRQSASEASPQAGNLNQKPIEETPLLTATVSFGDLLAQTPASPELPLRLVEDEASQRGEPTVLGASTQKASALSQSTAQGSATLSAGSREIALYSPNLTNNSRITVIPENSIESALFVAKTDVDYFTVAVDRPLPSDIPFEWQILTQ